MTYEMDIAGLKRDLPLCKVTDDLYIGAFVMFGDVELTVHCAAELLKLTPEYDYLIAPEAKAIPLVYEMARQSGADKYFVARKKAKAYMSSVFQVHVKSITTQGVQTLVLDQTDAELIHGKRIVIVDDVISTGESLRAMEELVNEAGGIIVGKMAVLAEGDANDRPDITVISDTLVAIMAGLAVIPAAVANGIAKGMAVSEIKLGGPNLLFATLQDVFHDMGTIGGIFGLIFYALVLIAAISSAISLIEAVSVTFIDHASAKGHERDRNKVLAVVCLAITLLACLVAVDGLGSNGIAPKDLFHINSKADWCADWLDFMDMISEGIAMPLGAMLMSIMVGWEIKPKSLYGEIDSGYNGHIHGFYTFCIKYLCPVIMFFILLVQISTFFGLGWFN